MANFIFYFMVYNLPDLGAQMFSYIQP